MWLADADDPLTAGPDEDQEQIFLSSDRRGDRCCYSLLLSSEQGVFRSDDYSTNLTLIVGGQANGRVDEDEGVSATTLVGTLRELNALLPKMFFLPSIGFLGTIELLLLLCDSTQPIPLCFIQHWSVMIEAVSHPPEWILPYQPLTMLEVGGQVSLRDP